MSWYQAGRTRLRLLFGRAAAESRMEEEIRFHVEMEAERLIREEGLGLREARRRALVAFGGVEKTKEALREGRGLAWVSGLRLDLKLGVRLLRKHPVLTLASVVALATAVALAASWFEFMTDMNHPRIPLPDGDRIVAVRVHDLAAAATERRTLHDFERWRSEVGSIRDLSAASPVEYLVTTQDGRVGTLKGVRATPSMFRLAGVQPALGRVLTDADDRAGGDPVAVIGHDAWQRLFDGDRAVIGQTVRVGAELATVVGVMPDGFGFPLNHEVWIPLRESAVSYGHRAGPEIMVFGRLAPGRTLADASAELTTVGERMAAESPATHEHLRPEARRFGTGGTGEETIVVLLNIPFLLFLVIVSGNVAILLFARMTTRSGELALRSALGANRRRIVLQLVAESLVLTSIAAALGLAAAGWGLHRGMDLFWQVQEMRPPFWWDSGLSPTTVLYVCVLAALGACVIGGLPAIRATGRQLRRLLPQPGASGAGMRFGSMATGMIVVQVALCVAFLPVAIMNGQDLLSGRQDTGFPSASYLSGRLTTQTDPAANQGAQGEEGPGTPRTAEVFNEVHRRLAAQPGIIGTTRASRLPGFNHPMEAVEIEGDVEAGRIVYARQVAVDPDFFEVMEGRLVTGRSFGAVDVSAGGAVAIVDQAWATATFGGQSVVGRRIRYPRRPADQGGRWYEIVGVVEGIDRAVGPGSTVALFHPLRPEEHTALHSFMRTSGNPAALVPTVHALVSSVDPGAGMAELMPLEDVWRPVQRADTALAAGLSAVALIILLFALIGIYALMSFTVAQRAREIGIRAALGANPRRIILAIFSRGASQIGLGILLGAAVVGLTVARDPEGLRLVAGVAVAMAGAGFLGCVLPVVRALRIQPVAALRSE